MGISISQTYAKIGITTTPARLEMQNSQARLELKQNHAKLDITTTPPILEIDQYEAFASAGRMNNLDLARDIAQTGYQSAMEYIGKYAADGDMLAAIEKGGNPIADIAERGSYTEHEFNYGTIPATGPKFSVTRGRVNIQPGEAVTNPGRRVESEFIPSRLDAAYHPYKVDIYMRQWPEVKIEYTGKKIDMYL